MSLARAMTWMGCGGVVADRGLVISFSPQAGERPRLRAGFDIAGISHDQMPEVAVPPQMIPTQHPRCRDYMLTRAFHTNR
jgi:hypothetical protein